MSEIPFKNPRLQGIQEQFERAKCFFSLSEIVGDKQTEYRLRIAAVYFCRAMVELMLESATKGEVALQNGATPDDSRNQIKLKIAQRLPFFDLIERIRIHDFHRFGILPPDPSKEVLFYGGPVKMKLRKGSASLAFTSGGPQKLTTGDSTIEEQRPLFIQDGNFYDDASGQFVSLENILNRFLNNALNAIHFFEGLLNNNHSAA